MVSVGLEETLFSSMTALVMEATVRLAFVAGPAPLKSVEVATRPIFLLAFAAAGQAPLESVEVVTRPILHSFPVEEVEVNRLSV